MAERVDAVDLKSIDESRAGSSPASSTSLEGFGVDELVERCAMVRDGHDYWFVSDVRRDQDGLLYAELYGDVFVVEHFRDGYLVR